MSIVVVGYEPGEVIGPFADRGQAYEWIMREHSTHGLNDFDILELRAPDEPRLKWVDLFGIDPNYCGGKPVDEWLDEQRGEA